MRRPSIAIGIGSLVGSLLGGPLLGIALVRCLAPGSHAAEVASFLAFPAALALGLASWLGLGVAAVVLAALRELARGRLPRAPADAADRLAVPPGHAAFVVWSVTLALAAGVVAGFSARTPFVATVALYAAAGLAYGLALRALARRGYLPFPEPG